MTKKNGKTTKGTFVVYNETEDGGLGSSSDSNSSSNRRKLADTAWVLEKLYRTGGWGEKRGDKNWRRNFTTEDVFERIVGAGVTSRRKQK